MPIVKGHFGNGLAIDLGFEIIECLFPYLHYRTFIRGYIGVYMLTGRICSSLYDHAVCIEISDCRNPERGKMDTLRDLISFFGVIVSEMAQWCREADGTDVAGFIRDSDWNTPIQYLCIRCYVTILVELSGCEFERCFLYGYRKIVREYEIHNFPIAPSVPLRRKI